ncbi:MAG: DUF2125 domain-containing protein [Rhodobacteraceae bacterium]|nr:DUF2125 domain-containing protein [Paracoccaceae bacterium]
MERGAMRRLLGALVAVAVLAGLGWGAGAIALRQGAGAAVQLLADQGRGGAGAVTVAGFPAEFAVTLNRPRLHQGLVAWQGDWVRLSAPAYAPWRLRLDLGAAQSLRLGFINYLLRGDDMRAALALRPGPALGLQTASLAAGAMAAVIDGGGDAFSAEGMNFTLAATGEGAAEYAVSTLLTGFTLPTLLQAPYGLEPRAELLEVAARVQLAAPLDRHTSANPPRLLALQLASARLLWGAADLRAEGELRADALGRAEGQMTLTSPNWREVVALALALRLVQPPYAALITDQIAPLASADGALSLVLAFREGQAWLGPVLLGSAPYLQ